MLGGYRAVISTFVINEVMRAPGRRRAAMLRLLAAFEVLDVDDRAGDLARGYLDAGILPAGSYTDAVHIATATLHHADYLATWNIRHMASAARRSRVREYNLALGHACPDIVTPEELLGAEDPEHP